MDSWRVMDEQDEAEFQAWLKERLAERAEVGRIKYNSDVDGFQGDPLEHLIEEQLDSLRYGWRELKRREAKA